MLFHDDTVHTKNDDAGGEEHEDGGDTKGQGVARVVTKAFHVLQSMVPFG